jgi:hypothetical protein
MSTVAEVSPGTVASVCVVVVTTAPGDAWTTRVAERMPHAVVIEGSLQHDPHALDLSLERELLERLRTACRRRGFDPSDVVVVARDGAWELAALMAVFERFAGVVFAGDPYADRAEVESAPDARTREAKRYRARRLATVVSNRGSATTKLFAIVPRREDSVAAPTPTPLVALAEAVGVQVVEDVSAALEEGRAPSNDADELVHALITILSFSGDVSLPRGRIGTAGRPSRWRDAAVLAQRGSGDAVAVAREVRIEHGRLFVSGEALLRGHAAKGYGAQLVSLRFARADGTATSVPMGATIRPHASARHFRQTAIDYRAAGFATDGGEGIDLADLDPGDYLLEVEVRNGRAAGSAPLRADEAHDLRDARAERSYRARTHDGALALSVSSHAIDRDGPAIEFAVSRADGMLSVTGSDPHPPLATDDVAVVTLSSADRTLSAIAGLTESAGSGWTMAFPEPGASELEAGAYAVHVSAADGGQTRFRRERPLMITAAFAKGVERPRVALIGSNATHDPFERAVAGSAADRYEVAASVRGRSFVELDREGDLRRILKDAGRLDVVVLDTHLDAVASAEADAEQYARRFAAAMRHLKRALWAAPRARIVLHKARAVGQYVVDGSRVVFDRGAVTRVNGAWDERDGQLASALKPVVVDPMTPAMKSSLAHPSGASPTTYERRYYDRFHARLADALGYRWDLAGD